ASALPPTVSRRQWAERLGMSTGPPPAATQQAAASRSENLQNQTNERQAARHPRTPTGSTVAIRANQTRAGCKWTCDISKRQHGRRRNERPFAPLQNRA